MRVNYKYLIATGFIIYASVFMLWSLMTTYGAAYGINAQLVSYVVTALATFFATRFVLKNNCLQEPLMLLGVSKAHMRVKIIKYIEKSPLII